MTGQVASFLIASVLSFVIIIIVAVIIVLNPMGYHEAQMFLTQGKLPWEKIKVAIIFNIISR